MTLRLTIALLCIVAAALAYPWQSDVDRWTVGLAAVVVLLVFAWWRGLFVTTMIARRFAVWRRNHSKPKSETTHAVTVLLRVEDPSGVGLPLTLVARYVERFGIRCRKVRVTSRDDREARTTWVSLTVDPVDNLIALQARSSELPLAATAEVAGRRLADHLRETGLEVSMVTAADVTDPPAGHGRERWSGVADERGYVSAYGIPVDERLSERLAEIWAQPSETWTGLEFTGTSADPMVSAVCSFRTAEAVRGVPIAGLTTLRGIQRPLLTALDPRDSDRLGVLTSPLQADVLERVAWPVTTGQIATRA